MKNKIAIRVGQTVVTICMDTRGKLDDMFSLSGSTYELQVSSEDEIRDDQHELITGNLDIFVNDLEDSSISDLVEDRVDNIFAGYDTNDDDLAQSVSDNDLIKVTFVGGGQNYDDLLELLPDNKDIKQLVKIWKEYHLQTNVDQSIIDQVNDIFDRLDSGKDEFELAEDILEDYEKGILNDYVTTD